MIVRIVKLTFRKEEMESFKKILLDSKEKIRAFPGVLRLEILQCESDPSIFFTYSYWESLDDLENYRHSPLFKDTWAKTKALFAKPAEAWSNNRLHLLD